MEIWIPLFGARTRFTPAMRKTQIAVNWWCVICGWGIFPLTLVAVFGAVLAQMHLHPEQFPAHVPAIRWVMLAGVFVGAMALFVTIGLLARWQIRRLKAGEAPWPWRRVGE
jgi:hypothetical protein